MYINFTHQLKIKHSISQLSIDTGKEIIEYQNSSTCTVKELPKKCPDQEPRYHLFRFKHTHEGDYTESVSESFY